MESEGIRYIKQPVIQEPVWKKIIVESSLPESLSPLRDLSRNLWWVWNTEARELFQFIDAQIWEECEHNPIKLLDEVSYKRFLELEKDEVFLAKMHSCFQEFPKLYGCTKKSGRTADCIFQYGIRVA